jgi:hypothetical protein
MRNFTSAVLVGVLSFGVAFAAATASDTTNKSSDQRSRTTVAADAQARQIEELSPVQRTSLPDGTTVKLPHGRVVTLGVLRLEHRKRLARFARLASSRPRIVSKQPARGALVAMKPITNGPVDYKAFCNAAHASGCLWFPPSTYLGASGVAWGTVASRNAWVDVDPLITDASLCASEGGSESFYGCLYYYPASDKANFNPGPPPPGKAIGTGLTSTQQCSSKITAIVDPNGAILISAPAPSPSALPLITGPTALSCVVSVYLPPKTGHIR